MRKAGEKEMDEEDRQTDGKGRQMGNADGWGR